MIWVTSSMFFLALDGGGFVVFFLVAGCESFVRIHMVNITEIDLMD